MILSIRDLVVRFDTRRGPLTAVGGVSFDLGRGETLGIVGESGCGKSTLGRAVLRLVEPAAGTISLEGAELTGRSRASLRTARRDIQMVFQDPLASLDPRWTVGDLIAEPLVIHGIGGRAARRARVADLIAKVGLQPDAAGRHPHAFSGGQRQRIAIARALALEPKVVVLDEPVSALDVSVQAQILNLLQDLQETLGVAFLFISHDLSVVEHVSARVAVMYLGRIVEIGERRALFRQPAHSYTRALLDAVPRISRSRSARPPRAATELPSPYAPPSGCPYRTRCPIATQRCTEERPALREIAPGQSVACHLAIGAA